MLIKSLTTFQYNKLINDKKIKASVANLTQRRQVSAIQMWMIANGKNGLLEVWPAKKHEELQAHVLNIANYLGLYVDHPEFKIALRELSGAHSYKKIEGELGSVPADIVQQVCEKYNIQPCVIKAAVGCYAAKQGENGVKEVTHKTYVAELKLIAMRKDRIFARKPELGEKKYLFNKVDKGLH